MKKKTFTPEVEQSIINDLNANMKAEEISKKYGICTATLRKFRLEHGYKVNEYKRKNETQKMVKCPNCFRKLASLWNRRVNSGK